MSQTKRPLKKLNIVVVVLNGIGHIIPMCHIAEALIEAGHQVQFVCIQDDSRAKIEKIINSYGCKVHFTSCDGYGVTYTLEKDKTIGEQFTDRIEKSMVHWKPHCIKKIKELKPDVLLVDLVTAPGFTAADQLNIPMVLNSPLPTVFLSEFGGIFLPNFQHASRWFGSVSWGQNFKTWIIRNAFKWLKPYMASEFYSVNRRVVLFNSYIGLEKPSCLPSNFIFNGPLANYAGDLKQQLAKKDKELYEWVEDAKKQGITVIYMSIGTVCKYEEWSLIALAEGTNKLGCKIVWSLPEQNQQTLSKICNFDPMNHPNFFIKSWIPQVELLAHDAVKAGLTHCGWGGCQEFTSHGIPAVTFPHFGDQPQNSSILVEAGVAVHLYGYERPSLNMGNINYYEEHGFTSSDVEKAFNKVLNDKSYTENAKKIQAIAMRQNGRQISVQTIENAYQFGDKYLIDQGFVKHSNQMSLMKRLYYQTFMFGTFCALGYVTHQKYKNGELLNWLKRYGFFNKYFKVYFE